jgi:type III pantothenate kinase
MRLVLDAGNSSIKYGLFHNHELIESGIIKKNQSITSTINKETLLKVEIIASCKVTDELYIKDLPNVKHIHINKDSNFPFNINYTTPETLGIDRIVACSVNHVNAESLLVIDCGTCVTYDYISSSGNYEGGAISPGIKLRFHAMSNFTDQLPLITRFNKNPKTIGNSTESCMKSGVINGLAYEMDGFISNYFLLDNQLKVFLTGGDAIFFVEALKSSIFAQQNLVLKGLDFLIDLNEK